jgi:hypothetical protein
MSNKTSEAHLESTLFGHPTGLYTVFSQKWERFLIMECEHYWFLYDHRDDGDSRGAGWDGQVKKH